jgi:hypothetical protein
MIIRQDSVVLSASRAAFHGPAILPRPHTTPCDQIPSAGELRIPSTGDADIDAAIRAIGAAGIDAPVAFAMMARECGWEPMAKAWRAWAKRLSSKPGVIYMIIGALERVDPNMARSALADIPEDHVWDFLALDGRPWLLELPPCGRVNGPLTLHDCPNLRSLPAGLIVASDLDLHGCSGLIAIGDGLTVGGDLDLTGCASLAALPVGLVVDGDIMMGGCDALQGGIPADAVIHGKVREHAA